VISYDTHPASFEPNFNYGNLRLGNKTRLNKILSVYFRVLERSHGSLSNILDQLSRKPAKAVSSGPTEDLDIHQEDGDEESSERFVSVLDIRRQMAKIKDSLKSTVVEDEKSDDGELFAGIKSER
jgi:hypothetical protein